MTQFWQMFASDSGNRDLRSEVRLSHDLSEEDVVTHGIELARARGGSHFLAVKTSPWRGRPGAWYIKGFCGKVSYEDILGKIQNNVENNRHSRRECILVRF